jgi:hypothetical protein
MSRNWCLWLVGLVLQLSHAVFEHGQRPGPANPLSDHGGRHRRPQRQQLPNLWFDLVHDRSLGRPLALRRGIGGQGPANSVTADPELTDDGLDRHALSPVKTADLRPILHVEHSLR